MPISSSYGNSSLYSSRYGGSSYYSSKRPLPPGGSGPYDEYGHKLRLDSYTTTNSVKPRTSNVTSMGRLTPNKNKADYDRGIGNHYSGLDYPYATSSTSRYGNASTSYASSSKMTEYQSPGTTSSRYGSNITGTSTVARRSSPTEPPPRTPSGLSQRQRSSSLFDLGGTSSSSSHSSSSKRSSFENGFQATTSGADHRRSSVINDDVDRLSRTLNRASVSDQTKSELIDSRRSSFDEEDRWSTYASDGSFLSDTDSVESHVSPPATPVHSTLTPMSTPPSFTPVEVFVSLPAMPVHSTLTPMSTPPSFTPVEATGSPPATPVHCTLTPMSTPPSFTPVEATGSPPAMPVHSTLTPMSTPPSFTSVEATGSPPAMPVHSTLTPMSTPPSFTPVEATVSPPATPVHFTLTPMSTPPSFTPVEATVSPPATPVHSTLTPMSTPPSSTPVEAILGSSGQTSVSVPSNPMPNLDTIPVHANMPDIELVGDSYIQVTLHRSKVVNELLQVFKDPYVIKNSLNFKFHSEKALDAAGVSRDVYAEFWKDFMLRSADGEAERVPVLSPQYGEEEWKALGRILYKGLKEHQYFPLTLSMAFVVALVHGENAVSAQMLLESFLKYIAPSEKEMVISALEGELPDEDEDEFLDFLSRFGSSHIPKSGEQKALIFQIAHKQLIQECKYILDTMMVTATHGLQSLLPNVKDIVSMFDEKMPSTKKVLKLFQANVNNDSEHKTLNNLKRFVKSLNMSMLGKFLRFVTGSDIISVDKIEISFTRPRGITRHPVAHTCGPVLEIPTNYSGYPDFRADFMQILDSNYLRMDIC